MLCDPRRLWFVVIALHGVDGIREEGKTQCPTIEKCNSELDRCEARWTFAGVNETVDGLKSCALRHRSCVGADIWFGRYRDSSWNGNEPCERATASSHIHGVLNPCDNDDRRIMNTRINHETFNRSAAANVLQLFLYDELYSTMKLLGCGLHADYAAVASFYWEQSARVRGPVDGVTAVRALAVAAAQVISRTGGVMTKPLTDRLEDAAMLMLRRLWFKEPGREMVGLRFSIDTHPRLEEGAFGPYCKYDEEKRQGWEITSVTRFADDSFGFVRGALYHVLECVPSMGSFGSCVEVRDGVKYDAPMVFVNLQHKLEKEMQDNLQKLAKAAKVTYEMSEEAFEAFVIAMRGP